MSLDHFFIDVWEDAFQIVRNGLVMKWRDGRIRQREARFIKNLLHALPNSHAANATAFAQALFTKS